MAYIWKRRIGNRDYYFLRTSVRKGNRVVTKYIANLGGDLNKIRKKLDKLPVKYSKEIRKADRTLNKFIESNRFLQKIKILKLKTYPYSSKESLEEAEACKLHWSKEFNKLDYKTKREVLKTFLIDFAYNSTSIEGNTIELKDAEKLLEENLTPADKDPREIFDLQNHEKVFFELYEEPKQKIDHELIVKIHDDLLNNIDLRKGYRTRDIRVLRSTFKTTPGRYVKTDMNLLLKWYNQNKNKHHPIAFAVMFHYKFVKIHPFFDGNGRTARMLVNYILMSKGYPPAIYKFRDRKNYIKQLAKLDKPKLTDKDYKDFTEYTIKKLKDSYWSIFL